MKKVLFRIIVVILVISSIFLLCYPFISNYLMGLNQKTEIEEYAKVIENTDEEMINAALIEAQEYNKSLFGSVIVTDPFDPNTKIVSDYEYESLLNINDDGIMGYVDIPIINVNLPIYHGTTSEVLAKGSGHLMNTSLPVGGIGTHSVITGHTAYSTASLFTDLNQLIIGDVFYLHVLNETLAYQVDKISVVVPSDAKELKIDEDKDYVTLLTCTPYGINSHRLLVRGIRIPYEEAKEIEKTQDREFESTWMREYKKALIAGFLIFSVIIVLFIIIRIIFKNHNKNKEERR